MTRQIAILGANSRLARELISELVSLNKKILACDFCQQPEWMNSFQDCQWLELKYKDLTSIEEVVKNSDCLFFIPHQSSKTQSFKSINELNMLLNISNMIATYARHYAIKKIIYLSTMIHEELSRESYLYIHFQMEHILQESHVPLVVVRIPMLLMDHAETFQMIKKLIHRLPFVIFPPWIEKQVQPIYWRDVVEILIQLYMDTGYTKINRNLNLPGPDLISYKSFFKLLAKKLKVHKKIYILSFFPLSILIFFHSLVMRSSKKTISQFYQSWNQDAFVIKSDWKQKKTWISVEDAINLVLQENQREPLKILQESHNNLSSSMILYRTGNVTQLKAYEIALEFFHWLQYYFLSIIRFEMRDHSWRLYFAPKLFLLREFKIISMNEKQVVFLFLDRSNKRINQPIEFSIELLQFKNKTSSFIKIKAEEGQLRFFTRKLFIFLCKRFNQYLTK